MATVSVSLPSDGTTAYVSDYNTPLNTLVNEFNGNIDNANIKLAAAIATSKLADDAGITTAKIASDAITPAKWTNPYKFSVYRNAAFNITNTFAKVQFDTELFDSNNNFDSTTNYRYTAPVAGFYQFQWCVGVPIAGTTDNVAALYKNGSVYIWGAEGDAGGVTGSVLIQLAATDYVEIFVVGTATVAANVGNAPIKTSFSGFLVSQT